MVLNPTQSNKICFRDKWMKKIRFTMAYIKAILHFFWKFIAPSELNSWVLPFLNPFSRFSDIYKNQ